MRYWLLKSEPDAFGWADLVAKGAAGEEWDGVRNYQARNHMREMRLGDRAFFYHSQSEKAVVGICEICAEAHPERGAQDLRWDCVDVRALMALPRPVPLSACKAEPDLADMALIRQPRLSVQPVSAVEWAQICRMGGVRD
ncbi:MAG: EVE domain-containing protein [Roseinatronobacter sp.]|nr:EVE domain-containing protein [Roseinatronobacter sp.]